MMNDIKKHSPCKFGNLNHNFQNMYRIGHTEFWGQLVCMNCGLLIDHDMYGEIIKKAHILRHSKHIYQPMEYFIKNLSLLQCNFLSLDDCYTLKYLKNITIHRLPKTGYIDWKKIFVELKQHNMERFFFQVPMIHGHSWEWRRFPLEKIATWLYPEMQSVGRKNFINFWFFYREILKIAGIPDYDWVPVKLAETTKKMHLKIWEKVWTGFHLIEEKDGLGDFDLWISLSRKNVIDKKNKIKL